MGIYPFLILVLTGFIIYYKYFKKSLNKKYLSILNEEYLFFPDGSIIKISLKNCDIYYQFNSKYSLWELIVKSEYDDTPYIGKNYILLKNMCVNSTNKYSFYIPKGEYVSSANEKEIKKILLLKIKEYLNSACISRNAVIGVKNNDYNWIFTNDCGNWKQDTCSEQDLIFIPYNLKTTLDLTINGVQYHPQIFFKKY